MVSTDTVIGIAGAVVLAGAMVAVFYYESQNPASAEVNTVGKGDNAYDVSWRLGNRTETVPGPDLAEGSSQEHEISVPGHAQRVTITLRWEDNDMNPEAVRSAQDGFSIEVDNGTGNLSDRSDSGNVSLIFAFADVEEPDEMRVRGNTTTEAQANLDEELRERGGETGAGTWNITVTLENTGRNEAIPVLPGGTGADTSNSYTLEITYEYWMPVLEQD